MAKADTPRGKLAGTLTIFAHLAAVTLATAGPAWQQQAKLVASNASAYDYFGSSVACSATYAVIGSPYHDYQADQSGAACIFKRTGQNWTQQAILNTAAPNDRDRFGSAVSITTDYVVVGAPFDDQQAIDAGAVYIFKRDGENWINQTKLTASDIAPAALFGRSVSIDGDYLVIGAQNDGQIGEAAGAAYIFKRDGDIWFEHAKLTASDGAAYDQFGWSVAISNGYAIIGAVANDGAGANSGAAYIFTLQDLSWIEHTKLTPAQPTGQDGFGFAVAITGDLAIVGVPFENSHAKNDSGSAYVYRRSDTVWAQEAKLIAFDRDVADEFGTAVSIDANRALVGAHFDDDKAGQSGSAYVFEHDGKDWSQTDKLTASDADTYDRFGAALAISETAIVVGAAYDDDQGENSGSVYVFAQTPNSDLNDDLCVDFLDFAVLASRWLQSNCAQSAWCQGADLDRSERIDYSDLDLLVESWLLCSQ